MDRGRHRLGFSRCLDVAFSRRWTFGFYLATYWWIRGVPDSAVRQYEEGRSIWDVMSPRERRITVVVITVFFTAIFIAAVVVGLTRR